MVTEGKEFPENSLIVGAPAKAVRTLEEKHVKMIQQGAAFYVKKSSMFKGKLKRIG